VTYGAALEDLRAGLGVDRGVRRERKSGQQGQRRGNFTKHGKLVRSDWRRSIAEFVYKNSVFVAGAYRPDLRL
jgi:hypothetical protein